MINDSVYPVAVFTARYNGTYEGAPWIAVQTHIDPNVWAWGRDEMDLRGCQGDDITCSRWFDGATEAAVGRGDSPNEAVADLARQLGVPWGPGDDNLRAQFNRALNRAHERKQQRENEG